MATFGDFLDEFAIEGGQILGFAARDKAVVDDYFAVLPLAAGVGNIRLERRPTGELSIADDTGFDEHPRAVAYRSDGFAGGDEVSGEGDGFFVGAQFVRVHHPAGHEEGVEIGGIGLIDG